MMMCLADIIPPRFFLSPLIFILNNIPRLQVSVP